MLLVQNPFCSVKASTLSISYKTDLVQVLLKIKMKETTNFHLIVYLISNVPYYGDLSQVNNDKFNNITLE